MKKEFTMFIGEIVKETIVAFITYMVLSVLAYAIIAWPLLKWNDKRQRRKEKEPVPSPESFENVERADDVHFTEEGHPDNQKEEEE